MLKGLSSWNCKNLTPPHSNNMMSEYPVINLLKPGIHFVHPHFDASYLVYNFTTWITANTVAVNSFECSYHTEEFNMTTTLKRIHYPKINCHSKSWYKQNKSHKIKIIFSLLQKTNLLRMNKTTTRNITAYVSNYYYDDDDYIIIF